jgi:hypothetical protein
MEALGDGQDGEARHGLLHPRADDMIPFADSNDLLRNVDISEDMLTEVGDDHQLADPEPLDRMQQECQTERNTTCDEPQRITGLTEALSHDDKCHFD